MVRWLKQIALISPLLVLIMSCNSSDDSHYGLGDNTPSGGGGTYKTASVSLDVAGYHNWSSSFCVLDKKTQVELYQGCPNSEPSALTPMCIEGKVNGSKFYVDNGDVFELPSFVADAVGSAQAKVTPQIAKRIYDGACIASLIFAGKLGMSYKEPFLVVNQKSLDLIAFRSFGATGKYYRLWIALVLGALQSTTAQQTANSSSPLLVCSKISDMQQAFNLTSGSKVPFSDIKDGNTIICRLNYKVVQDLVQP